MPRGETFGTRSLRWGALSLSAAIAMAAFCDNADARRRHKAQPAESYQPSYSSIVVDINSGEVMQATNADAPRHPASLTKIMTLYLLFERLEQGKVKLQTELPASAHAAVQAPSKLGLKPGETIRVETAIRAIVTKSANDVAVIVAEALGGDEPNFAKLMTAKARALGMSQTTYRNASGLPDEEQITTARDQALLGRAIQDRFPNYYQYFATRTFDYRGKSIRNHNHLLGVVDGVDGIKTGYIRDSGFNIVTSIRRANRHLVAVVFGGRSADARDARVRSLIENNINIASIKRTAPPVLEGVETAQLRKENKDAKDEERTGSARVRVASVAPSVPEGPAPGSTDPIRPMSVKTVIVHPATMYTASLTPLPSDNRQLVPAPVVSNPASITTISTVRSEPPLAPAPAAPVAAPASPLAAAAWPSSAKPSITTIRNEPAPATQFVAAAVPPPTPPAVAPPVAPPQSPAKVAALGNDTPPSAAPAEPVTKQRAGWLIQVGALPDETEARQRLENARSKAKALLGKADPFTERTEKGDRVLYRARFAGLEKNQAEAACKHLKRSDIPCMLLKN